MFIKQMKAAVYPPDGSRWFTETTWHPSWEVIAAAIHRLDRNQFPYIWLYGHADAAETDVPDFIVMGGQNAYTFGPEETLFYDGTHSGEPVQVWLSDQGASFPDWQVCHDLGTVLRATQLFVETGELDPRLTWRTLPS